MGGFFGACRKADAISDVFFGTDYHSHLGTKIAGISVFGQGVGLQRVIHNIENSPFRTKFDHVFEEMVGHSAIGCISDFAPQPVLIRSRLGVYSICIVGVLKNADEVVYAAPTYTSTCMKQRNRMLAERGDILIAYLGHAHSGSSQTASMASRLGKAVYNLFPALSKKD